MSPVFQMELTRSSLPSSSLDSVDSMNVLICAQRRSQPTPTTKWVPGVTRGSETPSGDSLHGVLLCPRLRGASRRSA